MKEVTFHLEVFDGPLDLLLHLLSKNKVEITDIPIAEILEQYLAYIRQMQEFDLEVASEFITMAAQLMYIKSKMLLPVYQDEEADDPRAGLVEALLEYRPDLSAEWLLRGVGDMLTTTQTANGNAAPVYQNNGNGGNNVTQTVANAEIADRLLSRLETSQEQLSESLSQNKQLISIISKLTDK